mgnify:CR=1 FL=1
MPNNVIALEPHEMRAAIADWVEKHFHVRLPQDTLEPTHWRDGSWCFPPPELENSQLAAYMKQGVSPAPDRDLQTELLLLEAQLGTAKTALELIRSRGGTPNNGSSQFVFQTAQGALKALEGAPDA